LKNKINWKIIVAIILIIASVLIYTINYLIFKDTRSLFFYLFIDFAFLPLDVLLVTLVIDTLLTAREKKLILNKLNMVIGTFFSEVGIKLLKTLNSKYENINSISEDINKINEWNKKDFIKFKANLAKEKFNFIINIEDEKNLKLFLNDKRDFLLRLLENPNLLEHESFTELLRAVFHLTEELANRESFDNQPLNDLEHIKLDIKRAYLLLIFEWISYMQYLKNAYPYLYSLALRQNPFNKDSKIIIS
jgi:uncharacterized protein (DUF2267 family)